MSQDDKTQPSQTGVLLRLRRAFFPLASTGLQSGQRSSHRRSEAGNVFFALFGAVAVVGVLGAGIMSTMRGPLTTMVEVNRAEEARSVIRLNARLVLRNATRGDRADADPPNTPLAAAYCDDDDFTEAPFPVTCSTAPTGGGCLPGGVGATMADPWGTPYGYCSWNHGPDTNACTNTLPGHNDVTHVAIAILSAGPDRQFTTTCADLEMGNANGDDIAQRIEYNDAAAAAGGSTGNLWTAIDADNASIDRNISVDGTASFNDAVTGTAFSATGNISSDLEIASPVVTTDLVQPIAPGSTVELSGNFDISGALSGGMDGLLTVSDALTVTGAGDFDSTLTVDGAVTINNTLSVVGNYATTLGGTLDVAGNLEVGTNMFTVDATNGNTLIAGTLGVTGATTLDSLVTINADGSTSGTDAFVVNNATPAEIMVLDQAGNLEIAGDLEVNGDLIIGDVTDGHVLVADGTSFNSVLMSGDVAINSSGATVIQNEAVTYEKIQDIATNILLGRTSAGAGPIEELGLGLGLAFSGTNLGINVTGAGNDECLKYDSGNLVWGNCYTTGGGGDGVGITATAADQCLVSQDAGGGNFSWVGVACSSVSGSQPNRIVDAVQAPDTEPDTYIDVDVTGDGSANSIVFVNDDVETMRLFRDGVSNATGLQLFSSATGNQILLAAHDDPVSFGGIRFSSFSADAVAIITANNALGYPGVSVGFDFWVTNAGVGHKAIGVAPNGGVIMGGGNGANTHSVLELRSENRGFLPPRVTTAERDAMDDTYTATERGMLIYNTTSNQLQVWNGTAWVGAGSGSNAVSLIDADNDTHIRVDTAGDGSANTTVFTNATAETMRITNTGNVGIGTTTPSSRLSVTGTVSASHSLRLGLVSGSAPTYVNGALANLSDVDVASVDDGHCLVYNLSTTTWEAGSCDAGAAMIPDDSLDWDKFTDTMTLDATTTINMDANNADFNFDDNTLFIDSSENKIGIGLNNPNHQLTVHNATRSVIQLSTPGNAASNQSAVDYITYTTAVGTGLGTATARGWTIVGRGDQHSTVAQRNDLIFGNWNGTTWNNTLVLDGVNYNVGVGTDSPVASAALDISSTTRGLLPPRMTTAEKDLIGSPGSPATGLMVFDSTVGRYQFYNGTAWADIGSGVAAVVAINDLTDGLKNTTDQNMFLGHKPGALSNNTQNTSVGIGAMSSLNNSAAVGAGDENTALGFQTLNANRTGSRNTAIGKQALKDNATGSGNTAIGQNSLFEGSVNIENVVIGAGAASGDFSASGGYILRNTVVGAFAGSYFDAGATSGAGPDNNVLLGYRAGDVLTTGDANIIIGYDLDPSSATANNELNIGGTLFGNVSTRQLGMGMANATGIAASAQFQMDSTTRGFLPPRMTEVERNAIAAAPGLMVYNTDANQLQVWNGTIWVSAGGGGGSIDGLTDGLKNVTQNNMFLGHEGGPNIGTNNIENIGVGIGALDALTQAGSAANFFGDYNVALGYNALTAVTTAATNTAVGNRAGQALTTGGGNTAIGSNAMVASNSNAQGNTAIGAAVLENVNGRDNIAIGVISGIYFNTGDYNTFLGTGAARGNTTTYNYGGSENIVIGNQAAINLRNTNNRNTIIGAGSAAGLNNGGSNNILLGYNTNVTSGTASWQLNIGNLIFGALDNTATAGVNERQVGIGVTDAASITASALLEVASTTRGFLPPRMTEVQRNAIAAAPGLMVYNTDANQLQVWNGTIWVSAGGGGGSIDGLTDGLKNITSNNMFLGHEGGANIGAVNIQNTGVGIGALDSLTAAGSNLDFFGDYNVALGYNALTAVTTAGSNTAIGNMAGANLTNGDSNTAIGSMAMGTSGSGSRSNVAIGSSAFENIEGVANIAVGSTAGMLMTYGDRNIFIGDQAGYGAAWDHHGEHNVMIGDQAGKNINNTNNQNTIIGANAGLSLNGGGSGNILLGYNTDVPSATSSNYLNIGNTVYGDLSNDRVGIGKMPDAGVELDVLGDIQYTGTMTDISDIRLKTDIKPLDGADMIARISALDTYTFRMKADTKAITEYGVMAQEIEKIFPELVRTASDEMGTKSVNYIGLIAPMIEATKSLKTENEALKAEIAEIKMAQSDILEQVHGIARHTGYGHERAALDRWMMLAMLIMMGGVLFVSFRRKTPQQ